MRSIRPVLFFMLCLAAPATLVAQDAQSRLWDAAIAGDTAALRKAMADGAKIYTLHPFTNPNGRYALNWATLNNQVDAVKLLLELKAPIEAENYTGFTALHHAAEAGSLEAAKVLLAAGADPGHTNKAGYTPQATATELGHQAVAQLLEAASRKKK